MEKESTKKRHRPKGHKRTKEQQEYDIAFCANLFLRGYTYREIADALNADLKKRNVGYTIAHTMVYYDMQQALIEWKRERMTDIDDYVTQELRKLDKMEVEAWGAWEASKQGKERKKNRTSAKPRKVLTEEERTADWYGYDETTNETSAGNPRFLDILLNVQQRRAKLLGFDAPVKIDIPGYNRGESDDKPKYDVGAIPKDLLFAVADKLQDAELSKIITEKGGAN